MAGNWWDTFDPTQGWGPSADGEVHLGATDQALSTLTFGAYGTAKGTQQSGDIGTGLIGATGLLGAGANWATGHFGRDDARAVDAAAQGQIAKDEESKRGSVLEQAKANKANAPYAAAGAAGLQGQRDLAGLNGPEAQAAAFAAIENSPQFMSMVDQSEQAILANASATGGLRGGNVQQSLAQNRPQILSDLINQQYARYGGLAQAGQQGSQFLSGLGLQYAGQQGDINTQMGQAQAGNRLGQQAALNAGRDKAIQYGTQIGGAALSMFTGLPIGGAVAPPKSNGVL